MNVPRTMDMVWAQETARDVLVQIAHPSGVELDVVAMAYAETEQMTGESVAAKLLALLCPDDSTLSREQLSNVLSVALFVGAAVGYVTCDFMDDLPFPASQGAQTLQQVLTASGSSNG